jgi:hypothetical protein
MQRAIGIATIATLAVPAAPTRACASPRSSLGGHVVGLELHDVASDSLTVLVHRDGATHEHHLVRER